MLRYIGAAAATGYPLEIPILTRSLAACIYTTPTAEHVVLDMDFKVLQALDAGTAIGISGEICMCLVAWNYCAE